MAKAFLIALVVLCEVLVAQTAVNPAVRVAHSQWPNGSGLGDGTTPVEPTVRNWNVTLLAPVNATTGNLDPPSPTFTGNDIAAFGADDRINSPHNPQGYTVTITPANANIDVDVSMPVNQDRWIRIRITPPLSEFPAIGQQVTYTVNVAYTHTVNGSPVSVAADMGTFTLQSGTPTGGGPNPPTPPTPVFPPLAGVKPTMSMVGWSRWPFSINRSPKPKPVVPIAYSNNRPILQSRNVIRRMLRSGLRPF